MGLAYEKQQGEHQQVELVGYLYPSQGKLGVRTLARAVRPPTSGQFEKLVVGLPRAVRPLWAKRAPKPFSLLTSTPTLVEVAKVGLEVC
jgi:hypothetical protein